MTEDLTDKKNENKKEKAKNYFLANKEKLQKKILRVLQKLLKRKRIKKAIMLTLEIKICPKQIEKEKKNT